MIHRGVNATTVVTYLSVLNFACALLSLLFLLFASVSIVHAYAHWMRSLIQTYIHHIRTYMPTKHETIHSAISSHDILLWFNSDGHLDFMQISSRRILMIQWHWVPHTWKPMFWYQNHLFVTIGWEVISLYILSILAAILDCEVSTNGILGDFQYVVLYNMLDIFWKNQLVTNLLNVKPNGPGLKWFLFLVEDVSRMSNMLLISGVKIQFKRKFSCLKFQI